MAVWCAPKRAEHADAVGGGLSVTAVVWTLWGWSIAYAGSSIGGIFGDPATGFLLKDTMVFDAGTRQYTAAGLAANGNKYPSSVDVSFQVTFAMITVALICGAIAERVKYSTWMLFVALWVTFDYAPMAHMVWNNGLLSAKGPISTAIGAAAHDFAGGTVVHINAAMAALIIVLIIGKRKASARSRFARTTCRSSCWARSCCGSAGSASTPARRSRPMAPLAMRG